MAESIPVAQRPPLRRQARPGVHPTGGAAPESPEVPTPDEVKPPAGGFEPQPMDEPGQTEQDAERPPSAGVMWSRFKLVEQKVEVLWLARQNAAKRTPGKTIWECTAEDPPGVKCGNRIESTPPGQPKDPPLVCPKHGQSPHNPVE